MNIGRKTFTGFLLGLVIVLSILGLTSRWEAEKAHRQFGLVVETDEVKNLSRQSGQNPKEFMEELKALGIAGVAVNELSGEELSAGHSGFNYGPLAHFPGNLSLFPEATGKDRALIGLKEASPWAGEAVSYLEAKFKGVLARKSSGDLFLLLPLSVSELAKAGVLPDFDGLEMARQSGLPVLYRPAPCPGVGAEELLAAMDALLEKRPEIKGILPQGLYIPGAPGIGKIGEWIRTKGLFLAQAEFNRQIGADLLNRASYPALVPIHSLTTDELLVKRLSREAVVERMIRATVERSVPLLLLRPYEIQTGDRKAAFVQDLKSLKLDLEGRGFSSSWPLPLGTWPRPAFGALAFGLAIALFFSRLFLRFRAGLENRPGRGEAASVVLGGLLLALLMMKVSIVARLAGALGSAMIAAEATLWTVGHGRKPFLGLLGGLVFTVAGGLALASFFSTPMTMLRLQPFSGVKITLLLPPLIVLAHDLKRRIYPESFRELLLRPMVWIEFLLVCLVILAAGILALRSDNTAFVGGWERSLRDLLERALVARPRTKELFIGYPAVILWFAMERNNWCRHAWILPRAAASIGFASAVNSFCHFHTHLSFILFRVFNGWWTGILAGVAALVILRFVFFPLVSRWRSFSWR
jgi:hypothetical protein